MTARTIRTAAELDALPVGSVVRGEAFEYGPAATIYVRQEEFWYAGWGADEEAYFDLPVVVLHDPSAPVVPSATREEVARTIDEGAFDFPEECAGDIEMALQTAHALLVRFTITPRTDR